MIGKNKVAFAVIASSTMKYVEKVYGMGWPWRRKMYGMICLTSSYRRVVSGPE